MEQDLSPIFDEIHDESCDQFTSEIAERVGEALERLNQALKGMLPTYKVKTTCSKTTVDPAAALSGAIIAFRSNVKERKTQINKMCEDFVKRLKKDIRYAPSPLSTLYRVLTCDRLIQIRATTDNHNHYFTAAMEDVYAAALGAQKMRGKRLHDVRSDTLIRNVTMQDGPYREIAHGVRKDYDARFKAITDKLWADLNGVFERTRRDVNQVCSTKEDDSPEAKKIREELLAMLPEARDRLRNEVWRELAKCKQGRAGSGGEE